MNIISLVDLISKLEDEKWDLVLRGAEFKPELEAQYELIDRKLDKLYRWYSNAYTNKLLTKYASSAFGPIVPPFTDRRKATKVV